MPGATPTSRARERGCAAATTIKAGIAEPAASHLDNDFCMRGRASVLAAWAGVFSMAGIIALARRPWRTLQKRACAHQKKAYDPFCNRSYPSGAAANVVERGRKIGRAHV